MQFQKQSPGFLNEGDPKKKTALPGDETGLNTDDQDKIAEDEDTDTALKEESNEKIRGYEDPEQMDSDDQPGFPEDEGQIIK